MHSLLIVAITFALAVFVIWLICGPKRSQGAQEEIQAGADQRTGTNSPKKGETSSPAPDGHPPVNKAEYTRKKFKDCRECWTLGIEVLGLIGLSAYGYITFQMWQQATEALHITQRPWVSAGGVEIANVRPVATPNAPEGHFDVDVAILLKNSGASVAREGATRVYIYPGYSGNSFTLSSIPTAGVSSGTLVAPFAGLTGGATIGMGQIWDNECREADAQAAADVPKHNRWDTGFVLAPGGSARYVETVISNGVTLENMNTRHFMLFGCVSYRDGFNIQHHTRYCFIGRGDAPPAKAELVDCALSESAD